MKVNNRGFANYLIVFILAAVLISGGILYLYKFNKSHAGTISIATISTKHDGVFNITGCKDDNNSNQYTLYLHASYSDPTNLKWGSLGTYSTFYAQNTYIGKDGNTVGNWGTEYSSASNSTNKAQGSGNIWENNTTTSIVMVASATFPIQTIGISTTNVFAKPPLVNEQTQTTVNLNDIPYCKDTSNTTGANGSATTDNQSAVYSAITSSITGLQSRNSVLVSTNPILINTKNGLISVRPVMISYNLTTYIYYYTDSKFVFIGTPSTLASNMVVDKYIKTNIPTSVAYLNKAGQLVDANQKLVGIAVPIKN